MRYLKYTLAMLLLMASSIGFDVMAYTEDSTQTGDKPVILQLTPKLAVDRIEPSAEFFGKVGFTVSVQVPEDDHMGFAILVNGSNQVMYQTRTSLAEDSDTFGAANDVAPVMIYITVEDVDAIAQKLKGYDVAMEMRETFYGAREISYKEPGGHLVTFAEFKEQPE